MINQEIKSTVYCTLFYIVFAMAFLEPVYFNIINENVNAYYNSHTQKISILANKFDGKIEDMDFTYYHEKCHLLWDVELKESQRNLYSNYHDNTTYFPTMYSRTSVEEDFAETCALYQVSTITSRSIFIDPFRYNFMKNMSVETKTMRFSYNPYVEGVTILQ